MLCAIFPAIACWALPFSMQDWPFENACTHDGSLGIEILLTIPHPDKKLKGVEEDKGAHGMTHAASTYHSSTASEIASMISIF